MPFSISPSATFSDINWSSMEGRPTISSSTPFCKEKDWYASAPCCMNGYTLEHVLDIAYEKGLGDTPEAKFIGEYPCLNGVELDYFYEKFTQGEAGSNRGAETLGTSIYSRIWSEIFLRLQRIFS